MKINEITEGELIKGPWGDKKIAKDSDGYGTMFDLETGEKVSKPVDTDDLEQMPLRKAFGGSEYNNIVEMGYEFNEKPSYFSSIRKEIPKGKLGTVQRNIGRKIHVYTMNDILKSHKGVYYPQADANWNALKEDEETFIVRATRDSLEYTAGDMFLANRTGASSYIRMWMRIS